MSLISSDGEDVKSDRAASGTGAGGEIPESMSVLIEEVKYYATFRAMLTACGLNRCLPSVSSIDDGVQIYRKIPGYAEAVGKRGVIALRISVVDEEIALVGGSKVRLVGKEKKRRVKE